MGIPTDSADVREQREIDQARAEAEAEQQLDHDARCRGGYLGLDAGERPIPCPDCRPELTHAACRTCSAPWQSCTNLASIRRGPCCDRCHHTPRTV